MLENKINEAITFLQRAEKLALKMQPNHGFWLAFSGGKDSCVIYELAKLAGVKFKAYYSVTTIDPPELVRFIIEKYPDVIRIHNKNFFELISSKKFLPTRKKRYCCEYYKEKLGAGFCTITGVRASESTRRKKQAASVKIFKKRDVIKSELQELEKTHFECIDGRDKIVVNPILGWSSLDVWNFLKKYNVPFCELYLQGRKRLGCLFCPNAQPKDRLKDVIKYPAYYKLLIKAVEKIPYKRYKFKNAKDMADWWFSDKSIKKWQAEKYQQYHLDFNEKDF